MLTPEDLYEIRKIVVAVQMLTTGQWDEQIKKIEQAAEESVNAAKQRVIDSERESAERIRQSSAELESKMEQAGLDAEFAQREMAQLEEQRRATVESTEAAKTALKELQAAKDAYTANMTVELRLLEQRAAEVDKESINLSARASKLEDDIRAHNARVEGFQKLAASVGNLGM